MERWMGKTAIVTGASSGIGESIADHLTRNGMMVVGLARRVENIQKNADALRAAGAKGTLHAIKCDMRSEEDILAAFEWTTKNVGLVHVLVNNAGCANAGNLTTTGSTDAWRTVIDVNLLGLCIATREASKIMMAHQLQGHIIHINSICGQSHLYFPSGNVYGATKHAVTNLTEMLRQEMVALKTNIKVTSISPGPVRTEIIEKAVTSEETKRMFANMTMLESADIADAVGYVLSVPQRVHINEITIRPVNCPL